jgi:hypothetical protein
MQIALIATREAATDSISTQSNPAMTASVGYLPGVGLT